MVDGIGFEETIQTFACDTATEFVGAIEIGADGANATVGFEDEVEVWEVVLWFDGVVEPGCSDLGVDFDAGRGNGFVGWQLEMGCVVYES